MRKLFTFLCAALMSVGMMAAVTPKGTDAWDDATKTLTVNSNPVSYAYSGVSDIENLVISDAVTSIGDNAFEDCNGLKSVSFGSSLASIGKEAFSSCIKLESVTFPASLQSIGKKAFSQCYALTSVTITNGLTSIEQQAFYNCEKLTSVTIPSSVTDIGSSAFGNCKVLTGIVVAAENLNYSSADGVLFDKAKTTLIQCPGGKQGEYTIPNSVTSIGNNAFASCYLLTSVEIPNSVGEIGSQAFSSCIELTSVTIGNGVTSIGGYAFYYSSKLASVTINATTPPTLGGSALDKTAAALTIYVPAESVDDYKGAWTAYADQIEAIPGGASEGTITVTWNSYDLPSSGSSFTKDGVTLTCDIDDDLYGPGTFTTDLGNFTQIVVSGEEACYIDATDGWSGNTDQKTWTGNAAIVPFNGSIYAFSSDVTIVFTIEPASTPEPAGKPIVVFEANGKKKEVEIESFPHTFSCSYSNKDGELDAIIKELYEISAGHCSDDNYPVASGNEAVLAGSNGFDNYITISAAFEGTATVSGWYWNSDAYDGDGDWMDYTLTISIKGDEPAPQGVGPREEFDLGDDYPAGEHYQVLGEFSGPSWIGVGDIDNKTITVESLNGEIIDNITLEVYMPLHWTGYSIAATSGEVSGDVASYQDLVITNINATSVTLSRVGEGENGGSVLFSKIIVNEGSATAIEKTAVDTKAVKRIVNGQLLIERDGKIYNVVGTVVR